MKSFSETEGPSGDAASVSSRSSGWSLLNAAGLGAALMYFLDPRAGRRRRALVRDQLLHVGRRAGRARRVVVKDMANRAAGAWAEAKRPLREASRSDGEVAARVRAKLGRYVSHPHAVKVTVRDGCVTLGGPILEREVHDLLLCVRHVPGVREVEDRLVAHKSPGRIPALQGGIPRPGERSELFQDRWAPAMRLMAGTLGGGLIAQGWRAGGALGLLSAVLGGGLVLRAAANHRAASLLGLGNDPRGIEVQKTVHIDAPVEQVYAFWADFSNFPHFMSRVLEVRSLEDGRSQWAVSGPGGVPVEWTAEITNFVPNRLIEWRTDPSSAVRHHGIVRFDADGDRRARVGIRLWYVPPAGVLGHAVASLFRADPKSDLDEDLARMKTLIETGRAPRDAAQPLLPRSMPAMAGSVPPPASREARPMTGGPG